MLNLRDDEYARLVEKADVEGETPAGYTRRVLLRHLRRERS